MLNIICEIANGYYGSLKISKKYIDMAKRAGANAVKFQIAYADEMLNPKDHIFEIIKNNEMSLLK
jgi:sialic acid synthase SpsE